MMWFGGGECAQWGESSEENGEEAVPDVRA